MAQSRLAARGTGRNVMLLIAPEQDIAAARPDCLLCTWVGIPGGCPPNGTGLFRLKYVSAGCHVHQHVRCLPG